MYRNYKEEVCLAGSELMVLDDEDYTFIMHPTTTDIMAQNRLTKRRREGIIIPKSGDIYKHYKKERKLVCRRKKEAAL